MNNITLTKLEENYTCPICLELNDTSVSLNPCGHELHAECAVGFMKVGNISCPVCRVNVESFRPAFVTRQAVESLLKKEKEPEIQIDINSLVNVVSFKLPANSTIPQVFKKYSIMTHQPISHFRFVKYDPLNSADIRINSLLKKEDSKLTFNSLLNLGHVIDDHIHVLGDYNCFRKNFHLPPITKGELKTCRSNMIQALHFQKYVQYRDKLLKNFLNCI